MPESDKTLPENSKENLDRELDHAVEETFPTSDPVSVTITKGGAIDYDEKGQPISDPSKQGNQSATVSLLDQAKETAGGLAGTASEAARGAFEQGRRYARQAADRYAEAERYYREGTQAVWRQAAESPLLTFLVGVGIGYALAWMIHSEAEE